MESLRDQVRVDFAQIESAAEEGKETPGAKGQNPALALVWEHERRGSEIEVADDGASATRLSKKSWGAQCSVVLSAATCEGASQRARRARAPARAGSLCVPRVYVCAIRPHLTAHPSPLLPLTSTTYRQ